MSNHGLQILLASCIAIFIYHHVAYPKLVGWLAGRKRAQRGNATPRALSDAQLPRAGVIVPAYNEEDYIEEKIRNLALIDYPRDRLQIVVALDGSKDRTPERAKAAIAAVGQGLDITLDVAPVNRGKVAVLNTQIAAMDCDFVMLTDASATMQPTALRQAAAHFADADVGVVFGTYQLSTAGSEGERAYTDYQTKLRDDEGALDSPMGGHGALYFFRRAAWQPMPPDTINDDFILPMSIVANGARAVYDRDIVAVELETTQSTQEFNRRVRIGGGNLQQAVRLYRLADPRRGWLAFTFISGKGTRPFMPFIGIAAGLATLALAWQGSVFYGVLLVLELLVLAAAAAVILLRPTKVPKLLAWLAYLVQGHLASLIGAVQVMLGRRLKNWQPTHSQGLPS